MPLNTAVEYFVGKSHIETGRMSDLLTENRHIIDMMLQRVERPFPNPARIYWKADLVKK